MIERWYVFDENGPYNWERARLTTGPYYDQTEWFDARGYETEEGAINAIRAVFSNGSYGRFYIVKGYTK